jgi:hypothetical protein
VKEISTALMSVSIALFGLLPFTASESTQPVKTGDYAPITTEKARRTSQPAVSAYIEDARTACNLRKITRREKTHCQSH